MVTHSVIITDRHTPAHVCQSDLPLHALFYGPKNSQCCISQPAPSLCCCNWTNL